MVPNVTVRTYKPRQQSFSVQKQKSQSQFTLNFLGEQGKVAASMLVVALVLGFTLTQILHGQMSDMLIKAEKLGVENTSTANENVRLLAARAQLTSKTKVAALAGTKLNLFEPDKGQVRRM